MILRIRIMFEHSHKKRKDSVETRAVLLIVSLERKLSGDFYEELLGENYLEAILATLASGAIQKIAAGQKEYHICSSCVITC